MADRSAAFDRTPLLEWIAAGLGLLLLAGLLFVLGREALTARPDQPPSITIRQQGVKAAVNGYVVTFEAINSAGGTAAALQVEGMLARPWHEPERSVATIDYVPGHGRAEGGLFFAHDPRGAMLTIRPTGYQSP